ncbi:MAG TPA: GyrI-like domain-containing protein [Dehalococcoidia bacterium]|nr:GyrI-like domain-containing protein [Dehalococcoidia bacterium]
MSSNTLEFAVHQLAGYRLLARTSPGDHEHIGELWDHIAVDREAGHLTSNEDGIEGVGAMLLVGDEQIYFGGAPSSEQASAEGYAPVDVPGGAYAMVTYSGGTEHIAQVMDALRDAVADAGEAITGDSIEVYRRGEGDEIVADLGLRFAAPSGEAAG